MSLRRGAMCVRKQSYSLLAQTFLAAQTWQRGTQCDDEAVEMAVIQRQRKSGKITIQKNYVSVHVS